MSKKDPVDTKKELQEKSGAFFDKLKNKEQEWEALMRETKGQANEMVENAKAEAEKLLKEARLKRTQIRQEYESKKKAKELSESVTGGAEPDEASAEKKPDSNSPEAKEEEKKIQELKKKAQDNSEKVIAYIVGNIL